MKKDGNIAKKGNDRRESARACETRRARDQACHPPSPPANTPPHTNKELPSTHHKFSKAAKLQEGWKEVMDGGGGRRCPKNKAPRAGAGQVSETTPCRQGLLLTKMAVTPLPGHLSGSNLEEPILD